MIGDAVFKNTAALMHFHQLRLSTELAFFMRRMNAGEHIPNEDWKSIEDHLRKAVELSQDLMAALELPNDGN